MTLRQEFDDIMNSVLDVVSGETEDAFIETVIGAMTISDEIKCLEEKKDELTKVVTKKEKKATKLRVKCKMLSSKLEKEKKNIENLLKEKEAMVKVLEDVRRSVMRSDAANNTSAEILSLIESMSLSDTSQL